MGRVLIVTPPEPLVTVAAAKDHLKVDDDEQDALIEGIIAAVSTHLDGPQGILGRAIGLQELQARFDAFEPLAEVSLPCSPIVALTAIEWLGADRQTRTGDLADVELIGHDVLPVRSAPWNGLYVGREALRVTYRAGYDEVPAAIRVAALMMVDDLFRNRGSVTSYDLSTVPTPATPWALLSPYRVFV